MGKNIWQKIASFIVTFSLLLNSYLPFATVPVAYAQEATSGGSTSETVVLPSEVEPLNTESPSPSPEPTVSPGPEVSPTPEPTIEPTAELTVSPTEQPAPSPVAIETESPTPTPTPEVTSTPTVENQTESTPAPASETNQSNAPPSNEPSASPSSTPVEEPVHGQLTAAIIHENSSSKPVLDLNPSNLNTSATISTDKPDYSPTETAIISGNNFEVNITYTLIIASSDQPAVNFQTQVTTDNNGSFIYSYQLDGNYRPNYQVEVKDALGTVIAQTTFTDAPTSSVTTVSVTNLAPANVSVGKTKVALMTFTVSSSASGEKFKKVDVTYTGTNKSDISKFYLYRESDVSGGTFDPNIDIQMDSANPNVVFTLDPPDYSMSSSTDYQFYIVADISASATVGNTVDVKVAQDGITFNSGTWPNAAGTSQFDPGGSAAIVTDGTPPTTTDSGIDANWHNSNVTVTLNCDDGTGSGCADTYHTTNGSTPTTGSSTTNPFTLSSNGVYTIKYFSKDNAGNSESVKTAANTVKIDTTNPTTTSSGTDNNWHNLPVTVTFSCSDSASGCDKTYYTTDGSTPTTSSSFGNFVTISTDGTYTVKYRSTDLAGNLESVKTAANTVKIDSNTPSGSITAPENNSYSATKPTFSATASDGSGSGIASVKFQYKKSSDGSFTNLNTDASSPYQASWAGVTLTTDTVYNLQIVITDNSDLQSTVGGVSFTYDTTDPTVPGTPTVTTPPGDKKPTWTWAASTDSGSGLATNAYSVQWCTASNFSGCGSNVATSTTNSFTHSSTLSTNTWYFRVRATDQAGNQSNYSGNGSVTLINDVTPPVITPQVNPAPNGAGWNNSDITLTWSVTDPESTVTSTTGCDSYSQTAESSGTIVTCSATSAGGTSSQSVTLKLDKTPPAITFSDRTAANANGWNSSDVTVNWNCSDAVSDVTFATATQTITTEGNNQTAVGTCTDNAGNTNSDTQSGINIDTSLPTDPLDVNSTDHTVSTASSDNTISMAWTSAIDGLSGVDGYSYSFTTGGSDVPANVANLSSSDTGVTSGALADGTWYFHFRTVDAAGNWTSTVHKGPYIIDKEAPSVPANLSTSTPTNNSTPTWSWDASTDNIAVDHYIFYWDTVSGGEANNSGNITTTSFTHVLALADGTWYGKVRAFDAAGNSSVSDNVSVVIDTLAPSPAGAPTTTSPTNNITPTWNWTAAFDNLLDHYIFFWSLISGDEASFNSGNIGVGTTAFTIPTALTENTWYSHVRAFDQANNSSVSGVASLLVDITPPVSPSATPIAGDYTSDQSVTLSSISSDVASIYYTTDGTDPSSINGTLGNTVSINKDMTVKAIAYDNAGNASTILSAAYGIAPIISAETSSSVSTNSVTVTWATDDPATSRVIYDTVSHLILGAAPNYGYASSTSENASKVTSHSVAIDGLSASTTYYYRTVSHGSPEAVGTEQSFATTTTATTTTTGGGGGGDGASTGAPTCNDAYAGGAPTLLSAVITGDNQVTLTWSKAADPVTHYVVTYGLSAGNPLYGNPSVGGKDTTSYVVNNLSGGTTYYFRVRAGNGCNGGPYSNELAATPGGAVIAGPAAGFAPGILGVAREQEATPSGEVEGASVAASQSPAVSAQGPKFPFNVKVVTIVAILILAGFGIFRFIIK